MQLSVQQIPLAQLRREAGALFEAHFTELSVDAERGLDVAWPVLDAIEERGDLHVVAAYVAASRGHSEEIVGYSVSIFVPRHLHYDFSYVQNDVLFVREDHRGTRIGGRLMSATRAFAKERGASEVAWHAKQGSELHKQLEKSTRFKCRDVIYSEGV